MLGEKKYSPPLGTTQSVGRASSAVCLDGFAPDIVRARGPPSGAWPMIGSKPGASGFSIGKPGLLAQPGKRGMEC